MKRTDSTRNNNSYDLVLLNGRVMDPESRLDAVQNIGISGGQVLAITDTQLDSSRVHRSSFARARSQEQCSPSS